MRQMNQITDSDFFCDPFKTVIRWLITTNQQIENSTGKCGNGQVWRKVLTVLN